MSAKPMTEEMLRNLAAQVIQQKRANREEISFGRVAVAVAIEVLIHFMGREWTGQEIGSLKATSKARRSKFLKENEKEPGLRNLKVLQRIVTLAGCMLNLQDVPGVSERLAKLREMSSESIFGELNCAALLGERLIRFVTPTHKKGDSYEAEFRMHKRLIVPCEIKTKGEDTKLSERTVRDACNEARTQLPPDRGGVVMVHIPDHWVGDEALKIIEAGVTTVLRQTTRILAIVVVWRVWKVRHDGYLTHIWYRAFSNRRCKFYGWRTAWELKKRGFRTRMGPLWIEGLVREIMGIDLSAD